MTASRRPLIGVTPRWEVPRPSVYMPERLAPTEGSAKVFLDAIIAAGGMPVMLPITTDEQLIAEYVDLCDGFAIPGGQDVNPALWGSDESPETNPSIYLCAERDAFEIPLLKHVLELHKPLFATCRGAQLLNVVRGGSLCMDVPHFTPRPGRVLWKHHLTLLDPCHEVEVKPGSLLHRAVGAEMVQANSSHHCCVGRLGEGVVLVGEATDGVPEAIEVPSEPFCLGVQWHPEYTWDKIETDFKLWQAFVEACG